MKKVDLTKMSSIFVLALVATLLWGSAYPCIKLGYEWFGIEAADIPGKFVYAGVRFMIAGFMTLAMSFFSKKKLPLPKKSNIISVIELGLLLTMLHYIFFYIGLGNTTGVKGAIVYGTSTIFSVVIAACVYKNDRMTKAKVIGCVLGFAGIVYVNLGSGGLDASVSFLGEGSMLIAAILFALGNLLSKKLSAKEDSVILTGWQLFVGGTALTIAGFVLHGTLPIISTKGILLLLYLALLSAVAFSVWTMLLQANPMGRVTIFNFLVPIFGVILSGMILGEAFLTVRNMISLACVSLGIFFVQRTHTK